MLMYYKTARPRQFGFSLIEILLVIGLIAVLSIAAFEVFRRVSLSAQVKGATDKVMLVSASTRNFFANHHDYTGLTTTAAVAAGIVDQEDLKGPWGDLSISATAATGFRIDIPNVSAAACKKLIGQLEPQAQTLRVGSTLVKSSTVSYDLLTAPLACDAGATSTVSFWLKN